MTRRVAEKAVEALDSIGYDPEDEMIHLMALISGPNGLIASTAYEPATGEFNDSEKPVRVRDL